MSMQGLISGSECAVPFNPLSQVLKHTEGDRSLQQDRVAGPSSSRLHHLPGTAVPAATEHDLALARQFFEGNASSPMAGPAFARPHIPPPEMMLQSSQPDLNQLWGNSRERELLAHSMSMTDFKPQSSAWASEFGNAPTMHAALPPQTQMNGMQGASYMPQMSGQFGMSSMMNFGPPPMLTSTDKGKGKSREIDFDAAFAQFDQFHGPSAQETARIEELDDTADLAAAMGDTTLQDDEGTDFKHIWDQLQTSDIPPPAEDMARWEAEFNQLRNRGREDGEYDYGQSLNDAWQDDIVNESGMKFNDDGSPILGNYVFETENKYLDPSSSSRSYLTDAKELLAQGGSLTEVALMLEAAIQKGDLGQGGWEAWVILGEVRSMDEREEAGMRALTEGVKRAEAAGATGEGMLSLAISFTNESYERASHTMLLRWLHARYPEHPISEETWNSLKNSSWHSHEQVTDTFLNLARDQHTRGQLDADVQIGLGVLFYTNGQYNHAKDCFEAALSLRPQDYLLWNRLGSCLSNDNKPEEALGAYREALQLRPAYTRAIYNVGVACLNIGAHKEAAEHFLGALAMQDSSGGHGTKSDQVWFTLRRTFLSMDRADLAEQAKAGTDLAVFRQEGFDF
ncbi:hypothetical protein BDY19DRAFT_951643 [Irpex rosettiformis]|uniref:Uncharacterized protein n=1 Tax=Irpex rosettiformis TaxID=378272 RepID=A0ACB8U1D7_9APHY|nr:hypothetical protein BDY19DRAFT_951643 [Irpex rosettiformis]